MTRRMGGVVLGWDVGGVNTKAARVGSPGQGLADIQSASKPYELLRDPAALGPTLRQLVRELGVTTVDAHALTMTAELSQLFRTKREGVGFVLDAMKKTFPDDRVLVYTVRGTFIEPGEARLRPLDVAASNWAATASFVATFESDALLIDIGTTTSDIIPIAGGQVRASGLTDPARLLSGELVYTGAIRTPAEALLQEVPLPGGSAGVSAEGFALIGDALLWLGRIQPDAYTAPTPDGRPATREFAGERLARVVCGDRDMLDDSAIDGIAMALAEAQIAKVVSGLTRVRARWPSIDRAIVGGLGDFIAAEAAHRAGLEVVALSDRLGAAARTAPAAAVAWLLAANGPSRIA
jgi:probable H4MPT-linked C1 transfer pathway protein